MNSGRVFYAQSFVTTVIVKHGKLGRMPKRNASDREGKLRPKLVVSVGNNFRVRQAEAKRGCARSGYPRNAHAHTEVKAEAKGEERL